MEVLRPKHLNFKLLYVLHTWLMYLTSFTNLILTRFVVALRIAYKYEQKIRIEQIKEQTTAGKFSNAKIILIACKIFENSTLLPLTVSLSCHSVFQRPQKTSFFSGAFSHKYQYLGISQDCKSSPGVFPKQASVHLVS